MMTEPYTADDRQAALILWKSASRRMSGYESAICQKIAENFPVSEASFAHFLELKQEFAEYLNQNVKGDAAAEPAPVQQGSHSPSHPPACSTSSLRH